MYNHPYILNKQAMQKQSFIEMPVLMGGLGLLGGDHVSRKIQPSGKGWHYKPLVYGGGIAGAGLATAGIIAMLMAPSKTWGNSQSADSATKDPEYNYNV